MTPEDRGIEVDRETSSLGVPVQSKALLQLEGMTEDLYSISLDNEFEDAVIWWTTTTCPRTGDPAVIYESDCFYGRMWGCQELYVALPKSGKTCGSALLHEFAHCLMMVVFEGNGDASHEGDIWDVVTEAHRLSCVREGGLGAVEQDWQAISDGHIERCGFEQ